MLNTFAQSVYFDLKASIRYRSQWIHPIIFFVIVISLFCIGLGFEIDLLVKISPAVIWMVFLITSLSTIETLFRQEREEGILEHLLLSPVPLWWLLMAKSLVLWITSCLPLLIILPILGLFMQLSPQEISTLFFTLLLGSPALTWLGVLGASLTLSLNQSSIFLALLLLPLYVPLLILGESGVLNVMNSQSAVFQMALLGSISSLAITLAPHGAAAALKASMDE